MLDEPTTGLHSADVHKLIDVLQTLVEKGNTVILLLNDGMGLRLYKDAFVEGDWESCHQLLKARMK